MLVTPAVAYLIAFSLGVALIGVGGVFDQHRAVLSGGDLSYIWAGARGVWIGEDPYSPASWRAITATLGTFQSTSPAVYSYPPAVLLLVLPLGALPLDAVGAIWTGGSLMAAAAAGAALAGRDLARTPAFVLGLAVPLSQSAIIAVRNGQWTLWLFALLCGTMLLLERRPALAGVTYALCFVKPHLFVAGAPGVALVAWRAGSRAFVVTLGVVIAAVVAASAAIWPGAWPAWLDASSELSVPAKQATMVTALTDLFGAFGAVAAAGFVVVAAIAGLRARFPPRAALAYWSALGLVTPVYARAYDHVLFAVPAIVVAGVLAALSRRAAGAVIAAVAVLLVPVSYWSMLAVAVPRGSESLHGLIALALFACVAAGAFVARRPATR